MVPEIESAISTLTRFNALPTVERIPDRQEVCAHALLSALVHHWPETSTPLLEHLLASTVEIRELERSRWMTQRRIAINRLSREAAIPTSCA